MIVRSAVSHSLAILAILFLSKGVQAQTEPAPEEKEKRGALVRIVCVQGLSGDKDEKITLASKTEDGKWIEFGDLTLRPPFISEWIRVPAGLNHVARREGGGFVSLASFTISPAIKGAILILIPNTKEKNYRLQLVDPAKLDFRKGKALIVNYSKVPAVVNMGSQTRTIAPGQQLVETVTADKNGMHPMGIGYQNNEKKTVLCYDRRVSFNPNTREFVLLFPDSQTGLRAMTLSEFGPFE